MKANNPYDQIDAQPIPNEQKLQCPRCNNQAYLGDLTRQLLADGAHTAGDFRIIVDEIAAFGQIELAHYGCCRCGHKFMEPTPTMVMNGDNDTMTSIDADTEVVINRTALATLVDYVASDVRDYGDTIPKDVREAVTVGKDSLD
jgi:DNA-directed RNA polymerase subunit RPC12/RpoP